MSESRGGEVAFDGGGDGAGEAFEAVDGLLGVEGVEDVGGVLGVEVREDVGTTGVLVLPVGEVVPLLVNAEAEAGGGGGGGGDGRGRRGDGGCG